MATTSKPEPAATTPDEERLGQALVTRGLLTRDEFQQCRGGEGGADGLLVRLVKGGFLTATQARRAKQELAALLAEQIPGYQLLERLGQGAMGTVYKARQVSMDRLVAVKMLSARLAANRDFILRFQREAHLAAKFSSNNVVQAIDVGAAGGAHYFVMEYVEGPTVKEELDRGRVFTEREGLDVVVQVAQALREAHRRGLIHRDVKPGNIILTADGVAKLADLGLARETADRAAARVEKGLAVGTPHYMAPEQVEGRTDIDIRADIYALGATLYHMVTGRPPFEGKKRDDILDAHLYTPLTPPDHLNPKLSAGLGEVVEFMMAKGRKDRYQMPADAIIDLECLLNDEPPRLARQRMDVEMLAGLAKGQAERDEEEEDEDDEDDEQEMVPILWVYVGGGVLALSLLSNLILLFAR
ncbi:MAG: serine/threonine protein kinase [Gemmataceae bacterium]|nr:serine/threonine protein kinase [Gemmataceae bacterium]